MKPEQLELQGVSTFMGRGSRVSQEDHVLGDRDKRVFVVADGFGGPGPGAKAAEVACESVRGFLYRQAGDLDATLPFVLKSYYSLAGNVLFNALIHANRKLNQLNQGKGVHERGGASTVAGFIDGDLLALANVGSCSAWLLRGKQAAELVIPKDFGRLCDPFSEVRTEGMVPLMALGMTEDLEPEICEYRLEKDDWLILNTDGIQKNVIQQLLKIKSNIKDNDTALKDSTKLLNSLNYVDNASICLAII